MTRQVSLRDKETSFCPNSPFSREPSSSLAAWPGCSCSLSQAEVQSFEKDSRITAWSDEHRHTARNPSIKHELASILSILNGKWRVA